MRLIVAGSRGLYNKDNITIINKVVLGIEIRSGKKITEIVHGACKDSPDISGKEYGEMAGLIVTPFPADWYPNGVLDRAAGHKRNRVMAEYGDILLVLWDGKSPGTKGMIADMKRLGKKVITIIL